MYFFNDVYLPNSQRKYIYGLSHRTVASKNIIHHFKARSVNTVYKYVSTHCFYLNNRNMFWCTNWRRVLYLTIFNCLSSTEPSFWIKSDENARKTFKCLLHSKPNPENCDLKTFGIFKQFDMFISTLLEAFAITSTWRTLQNTYWKTLSKIPFSTNMFNSLFVLLNYHFRKYYRVVFETKCRALKFSKTTNHFHWLPKALGMGFEIWTILAIFGPY